MLYYITTKMSYRVCGICRVSKSLSEYSKVISKSKTYNRTMCRKCYSGYCGGYKRNKGERFHYSKLPQEEKNRFIELCNILPKLKSIIISDEMNWPYSTVCQWRRKLIPNTSG